MKKYMIWIAILMMAAVFVAAEQPTYVSLQGRVTDTVGNPLSNGNLRVTT